MLPAPEGATAGVGGVPPPRTWAGSAIGRRLIGIGIGRFSADFASCSADIAWYISKPMKLMAL